MNICMKIISVIFLAACLILAPFNAFVFAKGSPIHNYTCMGNCNRKPVNCVTKTESPANASLPGTPHAGDPDTRYPGAERKRIM
jgi:hypothetical protein